MAGSYPSSGADVGVTPHNRNLWRIAVDSGLP